MNKYKPFGYYLLEMLKIIIFGALLVWLCSCNNREERDVKLIHAYTDTILKARNQEAVIQNQISALRDAYTRAHPPTRFTRAQARERALYVAMEDTAYMRLTRACTELEIKKILLQSKREVYKRKIDSLKVELLR